MNYFSISEAAAQFGVPESTLRYYEKKGLIPLLERDEAGRRMFSEFHMILLKVVMNLKRTNMPLGSIRQYVNWVVEGDGTTRQRLDMMLKHRQNVLYEISVMHEALDGINIKIATYEERVQRQSLQQVSK
ncbi:MerR family transcriptional regulator [Saccharibacillus sp. CPCC 101409]|uniref:MerR family transcriptional regulator n=1 Tax=Saccharibacillus sp. CPCC 101409 TaxID=3058041 RepID=UPI002673B314|nr:MerR family transcriptional regulator [Saccharibacillus sp. CPCC 101409]MDO3410565.1 MerR family transcriptional regulator [Saccharibacillus sp. CPCC 101409]